MSGIKREMIEGQPVLVVVDIQEGETRADGTSPIPTWTAAPSA